MRSPARWIKEQWSDVSRSLGLAASMSALRGIFNQSFFGRPAMQNTVVNYDLARSLYRNDNQDYNLGAGFVRPIIDLAVEYIGLPYVTSDNGERDAWLNECIHDHWAPELQQAFREAMRDSKTVVRFRQPRLDNPLFTESDRMHGRIETIPPEMCEVEFDPTDPDLVYRATITHFIEFDERSDVEVAEGHPPRKREHEIIEVITAQDYRFYDKTDDVELDSWTTRNAWRFVPVWPVWNEYDNALSGGQSDIEPVLPFIQAFHEVLLQSLSAHKYHSTPKAKFKLKDVMAFLQNNFPTVIDTDPNSSTYGKIKPDAKIQWSGRELFFLDSEEDIGFVEAKSVLGDSKTLLEFLIDCIAIASETPKWALLKDQGATDKDASVQPFEKKIARKRIMFNTIIVMLCKMAQAARSIAPETVRVTWPAIRTSDLAAKAQAFQQLIMAADVAALHEWMADETIIQIIASLFSEVNAPDVEKRLAANNVVPEIAAPSPQSPTEGAELNGSGSKRAAKRALATTTPSRS